jgi:CDP-6-deoxy-D-xylo-4-hexulose-3-dehydrase
MNRADVIARHVNASESVGTSVGEQSLARVSPCAAAAAPKHKKIWYAPYKFEAYGEEEIQAVVSCLREGWLAPGPKTDEFEKRVAEIFGKKFGVMVNSGSSANIIGLAALGMEKGDEVVTPALTFSTTVAPIEQLGLKPVFVDSIPNTYVPTIDAILGAITPKTKCIMIPNLAGSKIDWAELRRRLPRPNIWLFEDSADSITTTHETDIAIVSFYASHIITAGGMGGVVMFNDNKLKERALMFRDWGRIGNNSEDVSERFGHNVDGIEYDFKFLYGCLGYNMKACEMSAAFGCAQLDKLPRFRAVRKHNVDRYVQNLTKAKTRFIMPEKHNDYDWLAFPVLYHDRKGLLRFLEGNDVQVRVFFAGNITRHPAYRHHLKEFKGADTVMKDALLVGAHHGLSDEDVDHVSNLMIQYDRHGGGAVGSSGPDANDNHDL